MSDEAFVLFHKVFCIQCAIMLHFLHLVLPLSNAGSSRTECAVVNLKQLHWQAILLEYSDRLPNRSTAPGP